MMLAVVKSYWPDARCAKAFWGQHDLPPYRQLLNDTLEWANPDCEERWLDLGCGGGAITRAIWERTDGTVAEIIGADCAAANADAYDRLRDTLTPPPDERIQFVCHDFSGSLGVFANDEFDGVVSGLSISYAESFDPVAGIWTTAAYDRLLSEVFRVLQPGGRFVFSVNVPNPSWGKVARGSLLAAFRSERPLQYLKRSWRMLRYGKWLKREARIGRFHLLADDVVGGMVAAGCVGRAEGLSYYCQAALFRAVY